MTIYGVKEWKRIVILHPVLQGKEVELMNQFVVYLKQLNKQLEIDTVIWQHDKKAPKEKTYVRQENEWNHTDFSFFGKMKNTAVEMLFKQKTDGIIVFTEALPKSACKIVNNSTAGLKIGFTEDFNSFDLILADKTNQLDSKIALIKKYIVN
jgi:hypothetical protein